MDGPAPVTIITDEERLRRRAQIAALEAEVAGLDASERLAIPDMTFHHFASGVYAREMRIPAGAVVFGKIHRTQHLAVLLQGQVQITTESGSEVLEAPRVMIAPPGIKRVAKALTDTIWLAVHAVGDERDLDKIEQRFIAPSFDTLEQQQAPEAIR